MKNSFKVAVVGAGASGLFSCIELFNGNTFLNKKDVAIFERLDRVGKKLVATGNGQGNLTNKNIEGKNYFGDKAFIDDFIKNHQNINLVKYLEDLGISLCELEDGKLYPLSKQANSVVDIIRFYLQDEVELIANSYVEDIKKKGNIFEIITKNNKFYAENVILAVGGKASRQFGTDGSSYKLAQNFGHKLTKLYPSLVQIKTEIENIKTLRGIREEVSLSVLENNKLVTKTFGDLIFTEYGVSGNSVFKASSYITDRENIQLSIEFLPNLTLEQVEDLLQKRLSACSYIEKSQVFLGIVNKKVGEIIYKITKSKTAKELAFNLKNFRLNVKGTMGFDNAQVTRGGIATDQVDSVTYMSKLCNDLYLTGEMLDVDGECGGYNLTFAFVSGIVSAKNIKKLKGNINEI